MTKALRLLITLPKRPKLPDPGPNLYEENFERTSYDGWTLSKLREAYAMDEISFEDLDAATELVLLEAKWPPS